MLLSYYLLVDGNNYLITFCVSFWLNNRGHIENYCTESTDTLWVTCAHLEEQAGVLAGLSLQQCSLSRSSSEHKAQVPGRGDGHVILQVPPKDTVAKETMRVWHHWDGR